MAAQIYKFQITYEDCDNRIWRTAEVSSNYTLDKLGCMVLATFDATASHLFQMKYKDVTFFLTDEDMDDLPFVEDEAFDLLFRYKIAQLDMQVGDVIEMLYDFGCDQTFRLALLEIKEMPKGYGRALPKILDGAGQGIIEDIPASELLEIIRKTDADGHSGICYSKYDEIDAPEWDYRNYNTKTDNSLLKGIIEDFYYAYAYYED